MNNLDIDLRSWRTTLVDIAVTFERKKPESKFKKGFHKSLNIITSWDSYNLDSLTKNSWLSEIFLMNLLLKNVGIVAVDKKLVGYSAILDHSLSMLMIFQILVLY